MIRQAEFIPGTRSDMVFLNGPTPRLSKETAFPISLEKGFETQTFHRIQIDRKPVLAAANVSAYNGHPDSVHATFMFPQGPFDATGLSMAGGRELTQYMAHGVEYLSGLPDTRLVLAGQNWSYLSWARGADNQYIDKGGASIPGLHFHLLNVTNEDNTNLHVSEVKNGTLSALRGDSYNDIAARTMVKPAVEQYGSEIFDISKIKTDKIGLTVPLKVPSLYEALMSPQLFPAYQGIVRSLSNMARTTAECLWDVNTKALHDTLTLQYARGENPSEEILSYLTQQPRSLGFVEREERIQEASSKGEIPAEYARLMRLLAMDPQRRVIPRYSFTLYEDMETQEVGARIGLAYNRQYESGLFEEATGLALVRNLEATDAEDVTRRRRAGAFGMGSHLESKYPSISYYGADAAGGD